MPFPVAKLGYLAVKQIAKPFALAIKRRAKESNTLRKLIVPPAQWYHNFETKFKMRLMGLGKSVKEVKPLNEEMAVELGAEMLGEITIFSVGAGIIAAEYMRQSRNEQRKEDTQNDRLHVLEDNVANMGLLLEQQNTELRELRRLVLGLNPPVRLPTKIRDPSTGTTVQVQQ